ncbi:RNA polymerase sigma factor [Thermodesulfobacteriota bacterium]
MVGTGSQSVGGGDGNSDCRLKDLVVEAQDGSTGAFDSLAGEFYGAIYRMVFYRTRSRMDAEDVTQEVFVKAFKHLRQLKDPALFRPWLFRIASNQVRDFRRKQNVLRLMDVVLDREEHRKRAEQVHQNPPPEEYTWSRQFWKQVERFSKKLSKWEREVFYLRFLDSLAIHEISQVLGKSPSTVKTHLYRALEKFRNDPDLRHCLKEEMQ